MGAYQASKIVLLFFSEWVIKRLSKKYDLSGIKKKKKIQSFIKDYVAPSVCYELPIFLPWLRDHKPALNVFATLLLLRFLL